MDHTSTQKERQFESLVKENKALRGKIDTLERENRALKNSLRHLSIKIGPVRNSKPLDLDEAFKGTSSADIYENVYTDSVEEPLSKNSTKANVSRHFYIKYDFKGHDGAVYVVRWSPCGRFLASGSLDRTVRVWNLANQNEEAELKKHQLNVVDLYWANDSSHVLSGGYDHLVNEWNLESQKLTFIKPLRGMVQAVRYSPASNSIIFAGTSSKHIEVLDKRQPKGEGLQIQNNAMVSSLYVYRDGLYFMSGDSEGCIKTWDARKNGTWLRSFSAGSGNHPLTHLHVCPPGVDRENDEGRYLAVNSYDSVLRVYDRDSFEDGMPKLHAWARGGHKNRNWPIHSSFYRGPQFKDVASGVSKGVAADEIGPESTSPSVAESFFIATGSADKHIYIYDLAAQNKTPCPLIQRVDGHSDRVYATSFHPTEPLLASCSGDGLVKVWAARKTKIQ
eukprot:GCRY01001597.1.p1 GENE.GCRY01001597.1~~GCRY01001597.1.p1  ORF type:complete len:448 (+),score=98.08 GCRY01001597.1:307-1650(+)